jgi:hypothetical protein
MKNLMTLLFAALLSSAVAGAQTVPPAKSIRSASPPAEYSFEEAIDGFDREWFLVGALNDYLARERRFTPMNPNVLDGFPQLSEQERKMLIEGVGKGVDCVDLYWDMNYVASYIEALFGGEYPDLVAKTDSDNGMVSVSLYSAGLCRVVDGYYEYRPKHSFSGDTVYTGRVDRSRLQTEAQMLSFIAGVFFRNAPVTTTVGQYLMERPEEAVMLSGIDGGTELYHLSLPNSGDRADMCNRLLSSPAFGCPYVDYTVRASFIPAGHHVRFVPSEKVLSIIRAVERMKKGLEAQA